MKKLEFSKIILMAIGLSYFAGLIFGIYAVNKILMEQAQYAIQALISMFGYVGAPVGVAIGFYSWKAKNDNSIKMPLLIARNNEEKEEE